MWYGKKILEPERLLLKGMNRRLYCSDKNRVENELDPMSQALQRCVTEISIEIGQRMNWEGSRIVDRKEIYTMMLM
ncbi:hypothetical protein DPMN_088984 [Dreissena polymorpha]|uniref:Uncharacterized protein n=1 Tax=Dreissena polymorpha TaxID=45954 RepID=A0A9D4KV34_DREPO|nr:hypothetical protein DPMN_088984 [Dreissena polymorpha]